jgi:hypothetical protein
MALISNVVTGGTIAATWGNAVRDATVQVTTSAARPSSPAEGMVIYETDTNLLLMYSGSAWVPIADTRDVYQEWTTFTATLQQNAADVATTAGNCRYTRIGRIIMGSATLTATAGGTGSTQIRIATSGLPAPAQSALNTSGGRLAAPHIGTFSLINDDTTATYYSGVMVMDSSQRFILYTNASTSSFGNTGTFSDEGALTRGGTTIDIDDVFSCSFMYEAAS